VVWRRREESVIGIGVSSCCEEVFSVSVGVFASLEEAYSCWAGDFEVVEGSCLSNFDRSINWLCEMGFLGLASARVGSSGR
jgi:hypothetical protein